MIATLVAVSIVIFLFVRLLPGNIIDIMFGGDATATPEAKAAAARQLGLDGSYPSQYWRWVKGIFQGDMGHSLLNSRPISDIYLPRVGPGSHPARVTCYHSCR